MCDIIIKELVIASEFRFAAESSNFAIKRFNLLQFDRSL